MSDTAIPVISDQLESVRDRVRLGEQITGIRIALDQHIEDDKRKDERFGERLSHIERMAAQIRAIVAVAALLGGGAALLARWTVETVAEQAATRVIERQLNHQRGYP